MLNQETLREATRLTKAGHLTEATALLQQMLRGQAGITHSTKAAATVLARKMLTVFGRQGPSTSDVHDKRVSVSVVARPGFERTTFLVRTIASPAARNFPYDMATESTIALLRA